MECDTQKQADKDCLKTMQMMVDSLTDNKLNAANKITDLENSTKNLKQQLIACNDKLAKFAELEIENEAKDKQIDRLTNENEEQEADLKKLDEKLAKVSELSQQQTQELLVLEQTIDRWKAMEAAYHKLQHDNKELQAKFEAVQIEAVQIEASHEKSIPIDQHEDIVKAVQVECDNNQRLYEEAKTQLELLSKELEELKRSQACDEEKIDVLKEQLQHENEQLKKQSDEQSYKLNKYKAKICEFSSKLKEVKQSKKLLTATVLEYSDSVTKWQVQISHASKLLIKEVNSLNETKAELEKQLESSETLVQDLRKTVDDLKSQLQEAAECNETEDVKRKYEMLLTEYKLLEKNVQDKNGEIADQNQEWENVCTALKEENAKCGSEITALTEQCNAKSQQISELQEKETIASSKNGELLAEMRELNDVLKTRGEVISNQTAEIDEVKAKLCEQSKEIIALEESLKEKTRQLEQLRNQFDSQSEILSTSTISRADEVARMRDIEDSFEEKYNKLRSLAVKLKKKITEQQNIITKLETTTSAAPEASNTAPASNPAQAQNLISLQKDNDRLLDQIDSMKSEQKQLKSEINQLKQQIQKAEDEAKSLRIVNEDIKATADTNHKIKSALDAQIKDTEKQVEALKNENKNIMQQLRNSENEVIKIKGTQINIKEVLEILYLLLG